MTNNKLFRILALGALALGPAACDNAEYDVIENMVYINEASSAKIKSITMQEDTFVTSLTVRLAKAVSQDVVVDLKLDESLLDEYNAKNETDYQMIPSSNIGLPSQVTIPAGSVSAEPVSLEITPFQTEGAQYAIPVRILSNSGVALSDASSHFILSLVQPLRQSVPCFQWFNAMKAAPEEDWNLELPNYTLEWWVKMSGFSVNNQAIFDSGGNMELYIRFGDLVYADAAKGGYLYNFLQIKTNNSQFDSGDPNDAPLEPDTWYHFAITYNGSTGLATMYKNGEAIATLGGGESTMRFDKFCMISSGSTYFKDKCEMCQVRLWKTTRTAAQIKANMALEVKYTDPDLVLYLPMNETEGTTLHDVTGNGHNVEVGNISDDDDNAAEFTRAEYSFAN